LREDWKEDGTESKKGESYDKDAGEKCKGEIDEDSKEESKDHLVWSKDSDEQQTSISDSDESQEILTMSVKKSQLRSLYATRHVC